VGATLFTLWVGFDSGVKVRFRFGFRLYLKNIDAYLYKRLCIRTLLRIHISRVVEAEFASRGGVRCSPVTMSDGNSNSNDLYRGRNQTD
jgi:hypothetical protein